MERREFMTSLCASAAVLSAVPARAEMAATGMQHMHPPKYKALSDAAGKCVLEGEGDEAGQKEAGSISAALREVSHGTGRVRITGGHLE